MRRFWFISLLAASLCACAPAAQPSFNPNDGSKAFSLRLNDQNVLAHNDEFLIERESYRVRVQIAWRYFHVSIENKSAAPISLLWDDSIIVLPDGRESRIGLEATAYTSLQVQPESTFIKAGDKFVTNLFPVSNLGYVTYSGIYADPMFVFPFRATTSVRLRLAVNAGGRTESLDGVFTAQP